MEDLKSIWQKVNDLKGEVGEMLEMNKVETIYTQLKKEEDRQKKWLPWMIPYFIGMTLSMLWFYNWVSHTWFDRPLNTIQIIGTLLIFVGASIMLYMNQLHKIPLAAYEHDQTAQSFLKIVKEKLAKRRKMALWSNVIYIGILTVALNIISYDWSAPYANGNWSYLLFLNGFMICLAVVAVPLGLRKFDKRYKDILTRIDRFLVE